MLKVAVALGPMFGFMVADIIGWARRRIPRESVSDRFLKLQVGPFGLRRNSATPGRAADYFDRDRLALRFKMLPGRFSGR